MLINTSITIRTGVYLGIPCLLLFFFENFSKIICFSNFSNYKARFTMPKAGGDGQNLWYRYVVAITYALIFIFKSLIRVRSDTCTEINPLCAIVSVT